MSRPVVRHSRHRLSVRVGLLVLASQAALISGSAVADDSPLSLADLPAYQAALTSSPDLPATAVGFRDLWDHSSTYQGKRVLVRGRVERLFHQPAIGKLPALVEAWIVTPSHDPICLVFPDTEVPLGADVSFQGDYLRILKYSGGDTERLAPLIVGPRPPTAPSGGTPVPPPAGSGSTAAGLELVFTLIVVMIVISGFVRVLVRRPRTPARLDSDPDPVFDDGGNTSTAPESETDS